MHNGHWNTSMLLYKLSLCRVIMHCNKAIIISNTLTFFNILLCVCIEINVNHSFITNVTFVWPYVSIKSDNTVVTWCCCFSVDNVNTRSKRSNLACVECGCYRLYSPWVRCTRRVIWGTAYYSLYYRRRPVYLFRVSYTCNRFRLC